MKITSLLQLQKLAIGFSFLLLFTALPTLVHAAPRYPDLMTITPDELQFDQVDIDGNQKHVLRFTNTVWNGGEGPLELHGITTPEGQTKVTQWIYDDEGGYLEEEAGHFVWHEAHNHWHFENFAMYELWNRSDYDEWVTGGREGSGSAKTSFKTTFCIRETQHIEDIPGTPSEPINTECGQEVQGLSVGWGDEYRYDLPEQWIEIGDAPLEDGDYVLRSVADPDNVLKESPDDNHLESHEDNEAIVNFTVSGEAIETEPEEPETEP